MERLADRHRATVRHSKESPLDDDNDDDEREGEKERMSERKREREWERVRLREWIMAPADDNDYFPRRGRNTQTHRKTYGENRGYLEEDHNCLRIAGPVSPKVTHPSDS